MIKPKLIPNVSWCTYGEIISCPFCSSLSSRQHIYEEFNWVTINITTCNDCQHIYSNPRPTKESLADYYSSQYLNNPNVFLPSKKDDIFNPNSLWSNKLKRYQYYLSLLPKNNKINPNILDIGCSWGGLLETASQTLQSNSLLGVDVSSQAIDFIKKEMGFEGFEGTLLDYSTQAKIKFDYIFSSHSLEHSLEPKEELLAIKNLLSDEGIFFLTLPNHSSFMTNMMKGYSPAVRGGNHYHFFNHKFLSNELEKMNFKILNSFTSSLFSPHIEIITDLLKNTNQTNEQRNIESLDEQKEGEFLYFILQQAERAK